MIYNVLKQRIIIMLILFYFLSYKQRKFNLFREECEGFAKLVTELNNEFNENTDPNELIAIVQSLIGK